MPSKKSQSNFVKGARDITTPGGKAKVAGEAATSGAKLAKGGKGASHIKGKK